MINEIVFYNGTEFVDGIRDEHYTYLAILNYLILTLKWTIFAIHVYDFIE